VENQHLFKPLHKFHIALMMFSLNVLTHMNMKDLYYGILLEII